MKISLPVLLGFVVGMIMLVQYFVPAEGMRRAYNEILDWKQVVIGMTYILGVWSLMRYHFSKIQRKDEGGVYSVAALVSFAAMVVFGTVGVVSGRTAAFDWMFDHVQAPMQATMFSLLAFYVASASYRAFRVRSLAATLLLTAGVVVMLGRVPVGAYLAVPGYEEVLSVPALSAFILDVPNMAAKRGILIGVGLGVVATALKILLGIERTYLGKGSA